MMKNKAYSNGQKTFEQVGEELIYFDFIKLPFANVS